MASVTSAPQDMITVISDIISPLASEFVMFGLAALLYLLFTRTMYLPVDLRSGKKGNVGKSLKQPADCGGKLPKAVAPVCGKSATEQQRPWRKEMEEMPAVYLPVMQAATSGDAASALKAMAALSSDAVAALPPQIATKVLLTFAKTSDISEELMHQFMDLASHFDVKVFERAAAETSRWRSIPACRQLYNLAGLASIHKSAKLVVLLVRWHSNEHAAMRAMVEDILDESSGVAFTRSLSEALVAQCTSVGDQDTAKLIQGHGAATYAAHDAGRQAKLISNLGKEGNLQGAFIAFNKIKDSGAPLTAFIYNCLLDACIECKNLSRALTLLEEMKEKSLADVVSYNTAMKGHLANGDTQAARNLIFEMGKQGLAANRVSYHGLLNALVLKGDRQRAWQLVDEMAVHDIGVSTITCTILLKSISHRSQSAELSRILALSDSWAVPVDEVLFGAVADACIRCGSLKLMWERLMRHSQGENAFQVSGPTYGNMMKAYGQVHDVQRVKSLWTEMCAKNAKLSAITLGCMVEALVSNNLAEDAWNTVNKIWEDPDQRALVNTVIYSTIIKGFTMSRQYDKVVALYKEMKAREITCNTITYNTMLNALARCGMMHDVPQLLEDMRNSKPPIEPDIVTYSTIVKGYCISGELDKSFELLAEMKTGKVKPDEVLYNTLLDGCARQTRLGEALALLGEMREAGVTPSNYTLSIVCKLLGRARHLDQAFAMVESMISEYGIKPNIQVYTCLMQACFHNRKVNRALALHDEVVSKSYCTPDEKTYTVMARGCLQAGFVEQAVAVVRCAYHLPGNVMELTKGYPSGVEMACLEDVLNDLGFQSPQGQALLKDLREQHGITVSEPSSISSKELQRPRPGRTRGGR